MCVSWIAYFKCVSEKYVCLKCSERRMSQTCKENACLICESAKCVSQMCDRSKVGLKCVSGKHVSQTCQKKKKMYVSKRACQENECLKCEQVTWLLRRSAGYRIGTIWIPDVTYMVFQMWHVILDVTYGTWGTACCIWSVIQCQSSIAVSWVSSPQNVAKET